MVEWRGIQSKFVSALQVNSTWLIREACGQRRVLDKNKTRGMLKALAILATLLDPSLTMMKDENNTTNMDIMAKIVKKKSSHLKLNLFSIITFVLKKQ